MGNEWDTYPQDLDLRACVYSKCPFLHSSRLTTSDNKAARSWDMCYVGDSRAKLVTRKALVPRGLFHKYIPGIRYNVLLEAAPSQGPIPYRLCRKGTFRTPFHSYLLTFLPSRRHSNRVCCYSKGPLYTVFEISYLRVTLSASV